MIDMAPEAGAVREAFPLDSETRCSAGKLHG